jgi:hypothetical protein
MIWYKKYPTCRRNLSQTIANDRVWRNIEFTQKLAHGILINEDLENQSEIREVLEAKRT